MEPERMSDAADNGNIDFVKLDIDKVPEIAREHSIRSIPTFLLFKGGEKSAPAVVGINPKGLTELVAKAKIAGETKPEETSS